MNGISAWFSAKAEKIQQENEIQKIQYNAQIVYAQYAWIVMCALNNVQGVIQPVDLSEVVTQNSVPRNMIYRVVITRGTGANPNVIANIKNAVYNEISRAYNASLAEVRKTHKIDVQGDNILIKY